MPQKIRMPVNSSNVLSVIMGGGQGSRLFPLTRERSKPAVPLAGKYRLVDIPISNCINSGLRRIYLLTQFNSASLHRHISQSYKFDQFSGGFVEILAAEQTFSDTSWYQGTADAVRKNLVHFLNHDFDFLLILSGDQLYRMDFRQIIADHVGTEADITVATIPVPRSQAGAFGIMQIDSSMCITRFVEKPKEPAVLDSLRVDDAKREQMGLEPKQDCWPHPHACISAFHLSFSHEIVHFEAAEGRPRYFPQGEETPVHEVDHRTYPRNDKIPPFLSITSKTFGHSHRWPRRV